MISISAYAQSPAERQLTFSVTFSEVLGDVAQDGRLLILLATGSEVVLPGGTLKTNGLPGLGNGRHTVGLTAEQSADETAGRRSPFKGIPRS